MKRLSYGFIVLWLLSSLNVYAQSYYVSSSTGDDNKDGKTEATAWKTLTRYHQAMKSKIFKASDALYFKRGDTFQGQIYTTLIPGGTAQAPFIIGAYGDPNQPNPVITALQPINKWQSVKVNNIQACVADIAAIMNNLSTKTQYNTYPIEDMMAGKFQTAPTNLLFDGNLQRLARYPNDSYLFIDEKSDGDTLLDAELSTVPNLQGWVGGQAAVRASNWEYRFSDVKSINGTTMKLADSFITGLSIRNGYFFMNKLIGLDAPGEWFSDETAKKMYFVPPPSVSCAQLENRVSASVFELGVTLVDYTTVQDLNFTGFDTAILLFSQKQQMKVLRNKFNNNRVGVRGSGVSFIDISNNEMRNIYGEAITFWPATNANITNNLIENVGIYPAVKGSYNAIRFGSDKPENSIKNVIANNVIRNVGYSGIMFRVGSGKPGEESIIEKNVIERALAILADGGAIYLQDCNGNIIRSNLILNTYGNKDSWREGLGFQENTAFAFGIVLFLDNNNGNQLLNNTIINADDGIHSGIPIKNTVIKGNTLYNNRLYQLSVAMGTYTGTASLNYDVQNNILYAIDPGQWTLDQTKRDQKNWLFGTFDNNFYGNPYYNSASGSNIGIYGGVELHRYQLNEPAGNLLYNFDWWKTETGQDKNSKTDTEKWTVIKIGDKLYDVAQQLSPNLITNSTFDTAAPWEVMAGVITQEKKTGMDGGALHFVNDYSDASARLNNGHAIAFEKDQYYQLSFSTMRDTNHIVRVGIFDRTSTKDYKPLGGRYILPTGPKRQNYTYLFKLDELGTDMRVYFMLGKTDSDAWIDNVQLYKVSLKEAMAAQERSKIFVNRGATKKDFPLNGNVYKDLNGVAVKDTVTVGPYSSKILTYVSTTSGQRPGIPNFFMNLEGRKLTAKWSATNATGYRLYYAPYPACAPVFMDDMGPLTSITLDNLLTGTAYYATVTAYNQYGESDFPVDNCLGEASYFIVP